MHLHSSLTPPRRSGGIYAFRHTWFSMQLEAALTPGGTQFDVRLVHRIARDGGHLLQHETPPISQTTEQRIRGRDRFADWVLVACGYDEDRVSALAADDWSDARLVSLGAAPGRQAARHALSHTATPGDME